LSPQSINPFGKRFSLSPLKAQDKTSAQNQGIRIVESGELRVVNAAATTHWDYARDNTKHLKQHINQLRFSPAAIQKRAASRLSNDNSGTVLVKIGLSNINTPSMDDLPKLKSHAELSVFEHAIR